MYAIDNSIQPYGALLQEPLRGENSNYLQRSFRCYFYISAVCKGAIDKKKR